MEGVELSRNTPFHLCQLIFYDGDKNGSIGENSFFQQMVTGQLNSQPYAKKVEFGFLPHTRYGPKTYMSELKLWKHWEENIGVNLCDLDVGGGFLDMVPKEEIRWTTSK